MKSTLARVVAEVSRQNTNFPCHVIADGLEELCKLGRTLKRHYENDCNGMYSGLFGLQQKADRRREALQKKAWELGRSIGVWVYLQTDCRGCPIYIATWAHLGKRPDAYLTCNWKEFRDRHESDYNRFLALY